MNQKTRTQNPNFQIEDLWKKADFSPNEPQREAILYNAGGPIFITAGPGSGKTRVLLWRTLNLMVFHGVPADQIYLSTFTEKAALQLKEGLRTILGLATNETGQPYDISPMYIGTVHSSCARILTDRRKFSTSRVRNRPPRIIDELEQYFHIFKNRNWEKIVQKAGLDEDAPLTINTVFDAAGSQSRHLAAMSCISFFNRLSEECIDPANALKLIESGNKPINKFFNDHKLEKDDIKILMALYSSYLESLINARGGACTDLSLLQQEAYHHICNLDSGLCAFQHVIVDEYQDTNTIQERLFFKLAEKTKNLCIVGDDDQSLYRFRGATVENFVDFPERCKKRFQVVPTRISLSLNYRSRDRIVDFYSDFMKATDWSRSGKDTGFYRVADKNLKADRNDPGISIIASQPAVPVQVSAEIARFVKKLLESGKVNNPKQIAFLFPSMKYRGDMVSSVLRMKTALEEVGLKVYAPRAGRLLEVEESYDVFGLFLKVFGRPPSANFHGHDIDSFREWLTQIEETADELISKDPLLASFIQMRQKELEQVVNDFQGLLQTTKNNKWELKAPYEPVKMKRKLAETPALSDKARKSIASYFLDEFTQKCKENGRPLSLGYVINRATSVDWNILDLFYQLCGFEHFKNMFDLAEEEKDEGPVTNLGLLSSYLQRYMEEYTPMIKADILEEKIFQKTFFSSFLFALYRLGETEFEDTEDPFPKGRIPFLTIHQAKGLEFPVVVMPNLRKENRAPGKVDVITRPFLEREPGEPLERQAEFDIMRMFYVALSRAKNLLVLGHYQGPGNRINEPFKTTLNEPDFPRIKDFDMKSMPKVEIKDQEQPKTYSFTADYLEYKKCPRHYMIYRKYGFTPSRAQTMFFGSLVHQTLEDLHHELIRRREPK